MLSNKINYSYLVSLVTILSVFCFAIDVSFRNFLNEIFRLFVFGFFVLFGGLFYVMAFLSKMSNENSKNHIKNIFYRTCFDFKSYFLMCFLSILMFLALSIFESDLMFASVWFLYSSIISGFGAYFVKFSR